MPAHAEVYSYFWTISTGDGGGHLVLTRWPVLATIGQKGTYLGQLSGPARGDADHSGGNQELGELVARRALSFVRASTASKCGHTGRLERVL